MSFRVLQGEQARYSVGHLADEVASALDGYASVSYHKRVRLVGVVCDLLHVLGEDGYRGGEDALDEGVDVLTLLAKDALPACLAHLEAGEVHVDLISVT